jgi:protein-ribulosamine 3-kinase
MTSVPDTVQQNVVLALEKVHNRVITLKKFSFVAGGCINNGGRLATSEGDYFIKWNTLQRYPKMFQAEAAGLTLLKKSTTLHIPQVIGWFEADDYQGLLLEFVDSKAKSKSYWSDLGRGLAALHNNFSDTFGLEHSNYIGSLPQINERKSSWIEFFVGNRIHFRLNLRWRAIFWTIA